VDASRSLAFPCKLATSLPCVTRARVYAARQIARALSVGNIERVCIRVQTHISAAMRKHTHVPRPFPSCWHAFRSGTRRREAPSAVSSPSALSLSLSREYDFVSRLSLARSPNYAGCFGVGENDVGVGAIMLRFIVASPTFDSARATRWRGGVRSAFHCIERRCFSAEAEKSQTLIYAIFDARSRTVAHSLIRARARSRARARVCATRWPWLWPYDSSSPPRADARARGAARRGAGRAAGTRERARGPRR